MITLCTFLWSTFDWAVELTYVRTTLICILFHRDGAAVNFGVDKGVGVRMVKALGRPIVNHHCAGNSF